MPPAMPPSRPAARARLSLAAIAAATAAATAAAPAPLAAQAAAPPAAERAAVLAPITELFDAMRAGDSSRARAVFHPSALLATALEREGRAEVRIDSLAAFLRALGTPHAEVWDERLGTPVVQVDGPLASVWVEYAFLAGPRFSHCGVDAFQLGRTAAGWRIVALMDTRRRTACAVPPAPAPTAPAPPARP